MAYYIQKPSLIDPDVIVYYAGKNRWTDDPAQKVLFATEEATNIIHQEKRDGWKNSTVVSE